MDQRCLSVKPAPVVLKIWIGVVNVSFLSLISCYLFPSSFFPWFPLFNGSRHIHVNEQGEATKTFKIRGWSSPHWAWWDDCNPLIPCITWPAVAQDNTRAVSWWSSAKSPKSISMFFSLTLSYISIFQPATFIEGPAGPAPILPCCPRCHWAVWMGWWTLPCLSCETCLNLPLENLHKLTWWNRQRTGFGEHDHFFYIFYFQISSQIPRFSMTNPCFSMAFPWFTHNFHTFLGPFPQDVRLVQEVAEMLNVGGERLCTRSLMGIYWGFHGI